MSGSDSLAESLAEQPLLCAIQEMRETVVRLVEEHKARIAASRGSADEHAPTPSHFSTRSSLPTAAAAAEQPAGSFGPLTTASTEGEERVVPRRPSVLSARSALREPPIEPVAAAVPRSAPVEPSPGEAATGGGSDPTRPEDPRQRLDALAKLLTKRVKHPAPAVETPTLIPSRPGET